MLQVAVLCQILPINKVCLGLQLKLDPNLSSDVFNDLFNPFFFQLEVDQTFLFPIFQVVDTPYLVNPEWKNFIPGYLYNDSELELTAETLYRQEASSLCV